MTITKTSDDYNITLSIAGRLDSMTSTQLSDEVNKIFSEGASNIHFDLKELDYISSAGLRILIVTQKHAKSIGTKFVLSGVNESVKEVLDITGFSGILTII